MIKRKTYRLRRGDVLEVEEYHDGNYGAPGRPRAKKKKPTKEDMRRVNAWNKEKRCRLRLLEYFNESDIFATWTYRVDERPPDMAGALKDFQRAIRKVRKEYKKRGRELFWIRNIEQGTKGAWHIHLVVNRIPGTESIIREAWDHGGTWMEQLKKSERYEPDFSELASYLTKDEGTREKKQDGSSAKPRIRQASYGTSRNMPLPDPKIDHLIRWRNKPWPKKGYELIRCIDGFNPVTGYWCRRCTMIRIHRRI
ncbi:MAG: hypothetical protein LUD72_06675 [Bacteroidales bacterium]|nr:hypothetical protein [Bacteroidales bacterium]